MKGVFIIYTYFYPAIGCNFRDGGSTGHNRTAVVVANPALQATDRRTNKQTNRETGEHCHNITIRHEIASLLPWQLNKVK